MKKGLILFSALSLLVIGSLGVNEYVPEEFVSYVKASTTYNTYTVVKGDTLYSIAKRNNTSVSKLQELNNINGTNIKIGQTIKTSDAQATTVKSNLGEQSFGEYIVSENDTLYAIAKKHQTTVNAIKKQNNLKSDTICIGQKLKIGQKTYDQSTQKSDQYNVFSLIAKKENYSDCEILIHNDGFYQFRDSKGVTLGYYRVDKSTGWIFKMDPITGDYTMFMR